MTPYEQVQRLYLEQPQQYSFEEDLRRFSKMGYVFSTPKSFIMGYHIPEIDTWFIHAYAGELGDAFKYLPFPAMWVEFRRNYSQENSIHLFDDIKEKIDSTNHWLE